MKSTGIVRKIDELGRITLPMELRKTLGIGENEPLEIYVEGDSIILRKYQVGCKLCGKTECVAYVDDIPICKTCAKKIYEKYREVNPEC